jgi:hypothetical protein
MELSVCVEVVDVCECIDVVQSWFSTVVEVCLLVAILFGFLGGGGLKSLLFCRWLSFLLLENLMFVLGTS